MWRRLWIGLLALVLVACGSNIKQIDHAPAKPADNNFRSDTARRVASTGKPQLIELWADW